LQLLANPDQRHAMAQAAVERASTLFSWDRIAEDLLSKYELPASCLIPSSCSSHVRQAGT